MSKWSRSDAISHYHDLLATKHFQSTQEILSANTEQLSVAGRPVCSVLRPMFLEESTYRSVIHASNLVLRAIQTLTQVLLRDANLRKEMDLSPAEEAIVNIDSGYGADDVSARLDGFLAADGSFHFVEYNADSPGGLGYGDALGDLFRSMPLLREFGNSYPFYTLPVRSLVVETLLKTYQNWSRTTPSAMPNIAIVDWDNVATFNEFWFFQQEFEKRGCPVRIGDPRKLEYRNSRLFLNDFPVDLVYKRLVVAEMLARIGLNHPLVHAVKERTVCCVNGFRVQMTFKKALFALLSDPEHSNLFEDEVLEGIRNHIPWTRKVRECKTSYRSTIVDLVPFILANRTNLVLKPNADYGGKGVVLGWEADEREWEDTIKLAMNTSYVVQERVPVGSEDFPSVIDGQLRFDPRYFDLDPYVWEGIRANGCGVRLSKLALLNVSAGGGSATPLFVLTDR